MLLFPPPFFLSLLRQDIILPSVQLGFVWEDKKKPDCLNLQAARLSFTQDPWLSASRSLGIWPFLEKWTLSAACCGVSYRLNFVSPIIGRLSFSLYIHAASSGDFQVNALIRVLCFWVHSEVNAGLSIKIRKKCYCNLGHFVALVDSLLVKTVYIYEA